MPANHPIRKQIRLAEFDYSQPADYFITIVAHQRENLFGQIHSVEVILSEQGKIILDVWNSLPLRFPGIALGPMVIMPNHFHAIITITDASKKDHTRAVPAEQTPSSLTDRRKLTLPIILGYFKMNTAKQINLLHQTPGLPVWQRNYYEHIIRSDREYQNIESYIANNPINWLTDSERNAE
jgi:REP element-mobilizing transposase RayT